MNGRNIHAFVVGRQILKLKIKTIDSKAHPER